jgi:hypothetical protein
LQKCVAFCAIQVEFIIITKACKELLWLKRMLTEIGLKEEIIMLHSKCYTFMTKLKPSFKVKTFRCSHWIQDVVNPKLLELVKVHTNDNGANMMTKEVIRANLEACCQIAGLAFLSTESERGVCWVSLHMDY